MKRHKFIFVLLLLISISAVAYGSTFLYLKINSKTADSDEEFVIMTSCNPVYIATLNVTDGIDGVVVENLSQPTTGCLHDYTLTTQDMKNLSKADVLVINGGGMEGYLDNVMEAYPDLPIIDASADIDYIEDEEEHESGEDYQHGSEADHSHEDGTLDEHNHETNSHVWLSLELYKQEVNAIAEGLSKEDDVHSSEYSAAAATYITALNQALSSQLQTLQQELLDQPIVVLHEAYDYVALDAGAQVVGTLDLDEERQVSAGEVADIVGIINDDKVGLVLAEEDYGSDMGSMIMAETDAKVVYLNTLIHGNYEADDYVRVMQENYQLILDALQ